MGFNLENDESSSDKQLSLFDFQLAQKDFVSSNSSSYKKSAPYDSSAADLSDWLITHNDPEQTKTSRFMTLSAAIHAAAILATAMITIPIVEQAKTETITIEIADIPSQTLTKAPRGLVVPPTQGGTPIAKETPLVQKIEKAGSPSDIVIAKPQAKAKTKFIQTKPAVKSAKVSKSSGEVRTITPVAATKSPAHGVGAKTAFKAVPLSIDDIEAPELDRGELANAPVSSNLNDDFDDDFSKVNQSHKKALETERDSINAMASSLEAEQAENLNALDEANKEEQDRLASIQNSVREKNAKAIASALSAEKAAAAAAREAAAKEAASKKAGLGGNGNGLGMNNGQGAGNTGNQGPGTQIAGLPSGVRSLDQLRQMPGNLRPQYDKEERHRGDQGEVVFIAYISKEGFPAQFRLMKSTGFRNLDVKSLAALKKWRFYPGQEGWVELPFRWDLKGGVQQDGGLLRGGLSRR